MAKAIYICYFGIREPLVQTQVLPYLYELRKDGHEISLLTFEPDLRNKWTAEQITEEKEKLLGSGVDWHFLPYHKQPSALATAYDIFLGAWFIHRFIRTRKPDLLHGRVHVPTLMGAIARKFSRRKPKLLFDIRGFFPEEYTDAGIWPEGGWLYRSAKRAEKWLMKEADGFVVLTEKARSILFPESKATGRDKSGRPVEVIPCCVDLNRFDAANEQSRREIRERLGIGDRFVMAYVGSFGGWYLTDEMADLFAAARTVDPRTFVLVLTQRDKETVVENLRTRGFSSSDFFVDSVVSKEIPTYLAASDTAVSLIKACYSKLSSSPTKIAEYLAAGLPIIANSGVGDVDELINNNQVGVVLDDFSSESYLKALDQIRGMKEPGSRCRETAAAEFDLAESGGPKYRSLYNRIIRGKDGSNGTEGFAAEP